MANTHLPAQTLFPMLDHRQRGLARLAADATEAGQGHGVTFRLMKVRSVLNRSVSKRKLSLAYSINPYRGCEFGCHYCYARYTHDFPAASTKAASLSVADPLDFERKIYMKENAAWLLEQELRHVEPGQEIVMGTATDPYQPVERTALITRSLLKVFARRSGHRIGIVTKSQLIVRDADLLAEIARNNTLVVHLTITTDDAELARLLEPRAPRPDLRFDAVKRLRAKGIVTGILCSPLLPGLTDSLDHVDRMAGLATEAGASFFAAETLFLKSCSRPTYLKFIAEHFPHLLEGYETHFSRSDFADQTYRRAIEAHVEQSCRRHRIRHRSTDALLTREPCRAAVPTLSSEQRQALLFP